MLILEAVLTYDCINEKSIHFTFINQLGESKIEVLGKLDKRYFDLLVILKIRTVAFEGHIHILRESSSSQTQRLGRKELRLGVWKSKRKTDAKIHRWMLFEWTKLKS